MSSLKNSVLRGFLVLCCVHLVLLTYVLYLDVKNSGKPIIVDVTPVETKFQVSVVSETKCSEHQLAEIKDSVGRCMKATHLDSVISSPSLLRDAKNNAKYLYQEFRKVIPQRSLEGYRSYCWKQSYSFEWDKSKISFRIGNISLNYSQKIKTADRNLALLNRDLPHHSFHSDLVCLPKVFLLGFPKCGSTYTNCLINKIIAASTYDILQPPVSLVKETDFWVLECHLYNQIGAFQLTANSIGKYLFYFLPGLEQISHQHKKDVILFDSKVNKLSMWPKFEKSHHSLANYCILPSVLPKLLPGSKYMVVVRNPVNMLYSFFWYSCSRQGKIPMRTQLKGPDLFHDRVSTKIHLFNNCMRNVSLPSISHACELDSDYTSCILHPERRKMLDKCTQEIKLDSYSPEMPNCGKSRMNMGLYYVHIRKWLSVVPKDQFHFIVLEDLIKNPERNVQEMLKFLGLKTDIASNASLLEGIMNTCGTNAQRAVDYKHDPRLQMRKDTQKLLESFYGPFNVLLGQLVDQVSSLISHHW